MDEDEDALAVQLNPIRLNVSHGEYKAARFTDQQGRNDPFESA